MAATMMVNPIPTTKEKIKNNRQDKQDSRRGEGINMNFTVAVFQKRHMPSYVHETRLTMNSTSILSIFFPLMVSPYPTHSILH